MLVQLLWSWEDDTIVLSKFTIFNLSRWLFGANHVLMVSHLKIEKKQVLYECKCENNPCAWSKISDSS